MFLPDELIFLSPDVSAPVAASGSFARRVCVLALAEPEFPANREFLSRVLAAVRLNLDKDTLFAEFPGTMQFSFVQELKNRQPEYVLVFGGTPAQMGLRIEAPLYRPLVFYGVNWLFADALSVLEPDKNKKGQLWSALKQVFLG